MSTKCGGAGEPVAADVEVQTLVDAVRGDFEAKTGVNYPEFTAVLVSRQVVAGTNYFVKVHVGNEEFVHLRIFMPLPHVGSGAELHAHQTGKTRDDPLEYFS